MMLTFIPQGRISRLRVSENACTPYLLIPYGPFKSGHKRPVALIDQIQLASKTFSSPLYCHAWTELSDACKMNMGITRKDGLKM